MSTTELIKYLEQNYKIKHLAVIGYVINNQQTISLNNVIFINVKW